MKIFCVGIWISSNSPYTPHPPIDLFSGSWTSESAANFVLNEAKNVGDAVASARLFNEVQDKICRLQPFDDPAEQV